MARVYIGTSGWMYQHWAGNFYPKNLPQKDWLRYYSTYFDSVEVNSSFYRQPSASTFEKWKSEVPAGFTFSIKGNRFITHIKRLNNCEEPLEGFFESANTLVGESKSKFKSKKGRAKHVVLWQLPPSLGKDTGRLNSFLKLLSETGFFFRHAFEFRNQSWIDKEVFEVIEGQKAECAAVIQDWHEWPIIEGPIGKFVYVRFHGKDMLYSSNYSNYNLEVWAKKVQEWIVKGLDVYAYFNNDALGYAVPNAQTLKKMV